MTIIFFIKCTKSEYRVINNIERMNENEKMAWCCVSNCWCVDL